MVSLPPIHWFLQAFSLLAVHSSLQGLCPLGLEYSCADFHLHSPPASQFQHPHKKFCTSSLPTFLRIHVLSHIQLIISYFSCFCKFLPYIVKSSFSPLSSLSLPFPFNNTSLCIFLPTCICSSVRILVAIP